MPQEIQDYILQLAAAQYVIDNQKNKPWKQVCFEIRAYGRLKRAWGHGHIVLKHASYLATGRYVTIVADYRDQYWWLGVNNSIDGAINNLCERRMSGEYKDV